ncbi:MAG: DEAD/DEAH box helicase, partial [Spirochaetaceae bacterium]|nr:DEAD/DEAH box helicase [Spirochaetaceae bacterium]
LLLSGRDLLMESETGTGKTFAYLAPALELISFGRRGPDKNAEGLADRSAKAGRDGPEALIVAPTQELAVQIGRETERLVRTSGLALRVAVILGGTPLSKQEAKLRDRPAIVVGTLGRIGDLVTLRRVRLSALKILVLDEADRLLAPEAEEQSLALLRACPATAAHALVSATLPQKTRAKAAPFLTEPAEAKAESTTVLAGDIEHWCFYCDGRKRLDFLRRLEVAVAPKRCLVFLAQAHRVAHAVERLEAMGLPVAGIHAKLEKEERRVALERFASGELRYLVTSDLGARGLDIAGLSHVVSLDLPEEHTVYVHRAGRTGRAGAKGVSIVLADMVELERASRLAVRAGFVFRTKFLEAAEILEPTTAEFFERAERAEAEKNAHRAARAGRGDDAAEARRRGDRAERGRREVRSGRGERSVPDSGDARSSHGTRFPRETRDPLDSRAPRGASSRGGPGSGDQPGRGDPPERGDRPGRGGQKPRDAGVERAPRGPVREEDGRIRR